MNVFFSNNVQMPPVMRYGSGRGKVELDEVDRKLISALQEDGRLSMRALADLVGVALGTVSNRLGKLEENGVITGYTANLNPDKIGWEMTVVVGLQIVKGELLEVQELIASDPRVFAVYDVTGEMDSLVFARVTDRDDLDDFTKTVLSTDGVSRSTTHVVLNTVKEISVTLPPK
jgi:DNA-binding Lrp family transcriptional regulator|tara:strand:- start:101 stop:622 length:522 start_codon:yes stop_codon:yes gene_type:complete